MIRRPAKRTRRTGATSEAERADLFRLYEASVQDVDADCALVERMFRRRFGRTPRLLREDFCGSAAMACAWATRDPRNRAFGIDLDPVPLAWAREHHVACLDADAASRVALLRGDVRDVETDPVDVCVAFNFSYFVFKARGELQGYFEKTRARLRPQGLFVIDLYGGADSQRTMTETRDHGDYEYVWDQDLFDPITHRVVNHIHFGFRDGSRIERAFSYDWRLWSLPELRDVLHDAGFSQVQPYWERTDRALNEGNGVYYPAHRARDDPAWVAYVAAFR
jgi:SAM-dependent methyltransferase